MPEYDRVSSLYFPDVGSTEVESDQERKVLQCGRANRKSAELLRHAYQPLTILNHYSPGKLPAPHQPH